MSGRVSNEGWTQNGGDIAGRASALAQSRRMSAVLSIDVHPNSLQDRRDHGLSREREGELLHRAWQIIVGLLPPDVVGRRAMWSRFEFALEQTPERAGTVGGAILMALGDDGELSAWTWQIIFTKVFAAEPVRTLVCDPGYALQRAGGNVVAWVEPYPGPDWKESQRYPTVTVLEVKPDAAE
jgi:hypothetical protein